MELARDRAERGARESETRGETREAERRQAEAAQGAR